jgi:hypothetical protein
MASYGLANWADAETLTASKAQAEARWTKDFI